MGICARNPMSNETIESFGEKLLAAGAGLGTKSAEDVVNSDMKTYNAGDLKFSISQVEVSDHREITDHIEPLRDALKSLRKNHNLDFSMLMITDVVQGSSRVLVENPPASCMIYPIHRYPMEHYWLKVLYPERNNLYQRF
jgi:manganese-dependent inorganic pyrophosphatase